jgi:tetratricopeptide (TPR) repeat protein
VLLALAISAGGLRVAQAAPASEKQARERFQKAEMSFNLGRFSEALADYQAAYEAKPLPALLFNIAQCYRNMQSYERARFFFRRYLALDPKTTNRRLVDDLIAEMTRELDKQEKVDKREAAAAVAVDPLVAVASAAPPPPAPAPAPAHLPALALESHPVPPVATQRPVYQRWWFWTGAGAVVAGAVVAGILIARSGDSPSLGTIDGRHPP